MDKSLAPIALFAFRRPDHTSRVLDSLRHNLEAQRSHLMVFIDGPRLPGDERLVMEVRSLFDDLTGFASVTVVQSPTNQGLATSLIRGISRVLEIHDRLIVVEDDIVVSPHFLGFMNDHLDLYSANPSVASIHSYVYPTKQLLPDTFFIRGSDCWGWATWRRAWEHFNPDGAHLLRELRRRNLVHEFNFGGTAPYSEMLIDQIAGRNDSWAVRWYASAFLMDMVTLYPGRSLALNIGEDGSGDHGGASRLYDQVLSLNPVQAQAITCHESRIARAAFEDFFRTKYRIPKGRVSRIAWRYGRRVIQWVRRRRSASFNMTHANSRSLRA